MLAEIVLRSFRIELVEHEISLTREDAKVCVGRRVPERTLATTDRAVAIDDVVQFGSNLECDPAAMACALVGLDHGACLLLMLEDVDQFSERVADIEPAHSPRLGLRAIFDGDAGLPDSR